MTPELAGNFARALKLNNKDVLMDALFSKNEAIASRDPDFMTQLEAGRFLQNFSTFLGLVEQLNLQNEDPSAVKSNVSAALQCSQKRWGIS